MGPAGGGVEEDWLKVNFAPWCFGLRLHVTREFRKKYSLSINPKVFIEFFKGRVSDFVSQGALAMNHCAS